jgi:DNA invertase Pin-like site-specific DNA recombinase
MVTRIDRLARSIGDIQDIVRQVKARGATSKATEQPIDISTAAGKCFLDVLGVFAEFETNLRRERQLEGIAKAKVAGVYQGRPASIDAARVWELRKQGMGVGDCQGPQNRPCERLQGAGGLTATLSQFGEPRWPSLTRRPAGFGTLGGRAAFRHAP